MPEIRKELRKIDEQKVLKIIVKYCKVKVSDIILRKRNKDCKIAKQVFAYIGKEKLRLR